MKWTKLDWQDPFALNEQLSEEQRMVRDSAADYAQQKLQPRVQMAYREESTDVAIFREMGELGLLGASLHGYGCAGVDYVSYGLIAQEVEAVDSGYRSMLSVQSSLAMYPIYAFANEAIKQKYLPRMSSGEWIGCFGLTEPDHGSDPGGMRCRAEAVHGGYRLNGNKMWITNSPIADVFVVWAQLPGEGISGFVLDREMNGLSTPVIEGKLALRTSVTGEIVLQDVFVPAEQRLEVTGLKGPFACLNNARYGIAWGALGAARTCWHTARDYAVERQQFSAPLASKQLVQFKLAEMQTDISLGLQGCLQAGRQMDAGAVAPDLISLIKRNSCIKALAVARSARDLLGANGISDEYPVMRHMCNLEVVNTYEGTQDIHALILGRSQTGIAAF